MKTLVCKKCNKIFNRIRKRSYCDSCHPKMMVIKNKESGRFYMRKRMLLDYHIRGLHRKVFFGDCADEVL
jgi:hypothetical protein